MKSKADTTIGEWIRTGNISKMYVDFEDKEYLDALYGGIGAVASGYLGTAFGNWSRSTVGGTLVSLTNIAVTDLARYVDERYLKGNEGIEFDFGASIQKLFLKKYSEVDSIESKLVSLAGAMGKARGEALRAGMKLERKQAQHNHNNQQGQESEQTRGVQDQGQNQPASNKNRDSTQDPAKTMRDVLPPEKKEESEEQRDKEGKDNTSNDPPENNQRKKEGKTERSNDKSKMKVFKHGDQPDRKMKGYLVKDKEEIPDWAKEEAKKYGIDLELLMDWYGGGIKERLKKWWKYVRDKDYRERIKSQKKVWKRLGIVKGGKGVLALAHNEVAGALVEDGEIKGVRVYQNLFMLKITLGGIKAVSLEDYAVDYMEDERKGKIEFPLRAGVYKGYRSGSSKGYTIALQLIEILEGKGDKQHEVFGIEALKSLSEPGTFFHPGNMPSLRDWDKVIVTDSDGCIPVPGIYDPDVTWQNKKGDRLTPEERNNIRRSHYAAGLGEEGAEVYDVARDIYMSAKNWVTSNPQDSPVTFIVDNEIGNEVKGFIEYDENKDEVTFWMTGDDGKKHKMTKEIHRR